jgi:uncharacterized protein (TIGR02466 family)
MAAVLKTADASAGQKSSGANVTEAITFADEVVQHFPTTFMRRRHANCEDLNKRLHRYILDLEKTGRNKRIGTSNIGGFHSDTHLLQAQDDAIAELRNLISQAINDYLPPLIANECPVPPSNIKLTLWGWALVMREGNFNHQHIHPDANISGVYYVTTPKAMANQSPEQPQGAISFIDPRPRADCLRLPNQQSAHAINPEPGDMVVFPSYYEHSVTPFIGPGVRICVAFNAKLT